MEKEPQLNNLEENKIFESVSFEEERDKDGNITGYRSSADERKSIKLSPDSAEPAPGKAYAVEIIEDTDPENPTKGKYIGRIIEGLSSAVYVGRGKEIEENINEAEKAKRISKKASRDIYEKTGKRKKEREGNEEKEIEGLSDEEILEHARNRRVVEKALENEETFENLAEGMLGEEDSPERALVGLRWQNLVRALRADRVMELVGSQLLTEEADILRNAGENLSGSELEALEEIRAELKMLKGKKERLLQATPEAYYGLHLKELKEYKEELEAGRIVETPYVKEKEEEMEAHLRAGIPVFLYGHLGSGKTELAMHISKKMLKDRTDEKMKEWFKENPKADKEEQVKKYKEIEKEHGSALVISGSKHTSLAELYGHQTLSLDKVDSKELDAFIKQVENKFEEWQKEHPDAADDEKKMAHDRILNAYSSQLKGGTVSDFFLGPVYRAAEEGRPLIIDEVNAIPHEVLISLNHILTRKPGDMLNVQQDSGKEIAVKEGFGVIMTGNLNKNGAEQYIDRSVMDPAFLSRLHNMEYDYLPQETEGTLEQEAGPENELFQLMLSYIMDAHGNIEAPKDTPKKLWDLVRMAKITQNVFSGKEIESAYYFQESGGGATNPFLFLKENVLSIRALENILQAWKDDGFSKELDFYLWQNFISEATVPAEKAYLYQLFHTQSTFFKGPGWEHNPDYGSGGNVGSFDIKPPKNPSEEKTFFGPRDTVDFAFGKGPERTEWPKYAGGINEKEVQEAEERRQVIKGMETKKELEDFLKGL